MAGPRFLDRVRPAIRTRPYSYRTEPAYVHWTRRFVLFHGRHPEEMGKREVEALLTHLAVEQRVAPSAKNQALSLVLFGCKAVLEREPRPQQRADDHDPYLSGAARWFRGS
jgi:hypothetical protein